jgi:ParB/RepB/Spo0J family partition protein
MTNEYEIIELPIDNIYPSKDNPRKTFDKEQLEILRESIKKHDIIEPILIRKATREIIDGERRWRAEKAAGAKTVHVRVYNVEEAEASEIRLTAQLQRVDLNDSEKEAATAALWDTGRYTTKEELAKSIGITRRKAEQYIQAKQERQRAPHADDRVTTWDLVHTNQLGKVDPKIRDDLLQKKAAKEISTEEMARLAQTAAEFEKPEERQGYIKEQAAIIRDQKAERERAERLRKESAEATNAGRPPTIVNFDNSQRKHDDSRVAALEKLWGNVDIYLRAEAIQGVSHKHKREMCVAYVRMIADRANQVLMTVGNEIIEGDVIVGVREP